LQRPSLRPAVHHDVSLHAKTRETRSSLDRLGYRWSCPFCPMAAQSAASTIRPSFDGDIDISHLRRGSLVARAYAAVFRRCHRVGNGYRAVRRPSDGGLGQRGARPSRLVRTMGSSGYASAFQPRRDGLSTFQGAAARKGSLMTTLAATLGNGPVSLMFAQRGILRLDHAARHVQALPYGRTSEAVWRAREACIQELASRAG